MGAAAGAAEGPRAGRAGGRPPVAQPHALGQPEGLGVGRSGRRAVTKGRHFEQTES